MEPAEFKFWRESVGLTQDGASALLGVSRVTIQNWEGGVSRIPTSMEVACEMYRRRWKMRPEFGPVTLTYFDAPLWQSQYGPTVIPRIERELYPNNQAAISRLRELRQQTENLHNPLIIDDTGDVVWKSLELLSECEKKMTQSDISSAQTLWHKVSIQDGDVADVSARALIEKFSAKYRAAFVPKGVSVHHFVPDAGGHIYYFSPVASSIAAELLESFYATICIDPPDLSGSRKVGL